MKAGKVVKSLGMAAVALTLVSACMVGSTLAKYSSEVTGTGTAVVAKWALKAGSTDGASTFANFTLNQTSSSTGVTDGTIAPGTSGKIPVYYDLSGTEVATKLTVEVQVDDKTKLPENFVMKTSDGTPVTLESNTPVTLYTANIAKGDIEKTGNGMGKHNIELSWEWPLGDDTAGNGYTFGSTVSTSSGTSKFHCNRSCNTA